MNIKYFRSGDSRVFAVFEKLVHAIPGSTDRYYEGFVSTSTAPESLIIKNSMLEQCVEVSEAELRSINPAFHNHISMFLADHAFKTRILARDVTVGMVVHEEEMGPGFHTVTETIVGDRYVDDGYFMIATKELDLAHFKNGETVERIVHTDLVA